MKKECAGGREKEEGRKKRVQEEGEIGRRRMERTGAGGGREKMQDEEGRRGKRRRDGGNKCRGKEGRCKSWEEGVREEGGWDAG